MAYEELPIEKIITPLIAASILKAIMAIIKKEYERRWIERVCIGGPL